MVNPMKIFKENLMYWYGGLSVLLILLFIGVAAAAPLLAPVDLPGASASFRLVQPLIRHLPNPPSADYLLGTVPLGVSTRQFDVYYTLIWGTRSALIFGFTATLIVCIFGSFIGALSSFLGGSIGRMILVITDAFLAFPVIAGIVLFGQILFPQTMGSVPGPLRATLLNFGIDNVMLTLVFLGWMPYTRVIYEDMERIRQAEFILASQSAGAKPARIIFRHLFPNSISNVIVLATRDVSGLVLLQAAFTFLDVGGNSDWGRILVVGRKWILGTGGNPLENWWVFLPVTVALVIFGMSWNLFGDFLNEYLNPRYRFSIFD
jgi:peptide/nickel transport system permease protein